MQIKNLLLTILVTCMTFCFTTQVQAQNEAANKKDSTQTSLTDTSQTLAPTDTSAANAAASTKKGVEDPAQAKATQLLLEKQQQETAQNNAAADATKPAPSKLIEYFAGEMRPTSNGTSLEISVVDSLGILIPHINGEYDFTLSGKDQKLNFVNGKSTVNFAKGEMPNTIYIKHKNELMHLSNFWRFVKKSDGTISQGNIPLWVAIIPPLIAILLALIFKEVVASLFIGVWIGVFILNGYTLKGFFTSFFNVIDKYIIEVLKDPSHLAVIIFSLLIGGMVAVISKNGGMAGVVNRLTKRVNSARSSQFVTWLLGLAIFFDDYANTLIVGNTARSLTDRYRVSREKLAYIVDSTAAPVASIALVTTWIGAELGYIKGAAESIGLNEGAYSIFLKSLAYSYYPILTLIFILMLILLKRDFGPMLKAERRARMTGHLYESVEEEDHNVDMSELQPIKNKPHRSFNAVLPILTVIFVTMFGLIYTGAKDIWNAENVSFLEKMSRALGGLTPLSNTIGNADSYAALLWSSVTGVFVAVFLTMIQRIMSLRATMDTFLNGIKTMIPAMIILILAWSLAKITSDLNTAGFLSSVLDGNIQPQLMPIITFILAGVTAFATGSSWSTMAILYPILLPVTWGICSLNGLPEDITLPIFYNVTASVLAGSVFGDHCSPISDTTILSSLASNCNHIDHVKTQFPYALTVGIVSIGLSTLAVYMPHFQHWMIYLIGIAVLLLVALLFGRKVQDYDPHFVMPNKNDDLEKPREQLIDEEEFNDEGLIANA